MGASNELWERVRAARLEWLENPRFSAPDQVELLRTALADVDPTEPILYMLHTAWMAGREGPDDD